MVNDLSLTVLYPPSDRSQQFEYYCTKNHYSKLESTTYIEFLKDILTRIFRLTKKDGLCCLIFPKNLTSKSEVTYAHIISTCTLFSNHTWSFHDEIILTDENDQLLGKIAILKKNGKIETISRAEKLTHLSIPAEEKESISYSVWIIASLKDDLIDEKVVKWLILSYSNPDDKVHDPFAKYTNSKRICMTLGRKFLG